MTIYYEKYVLVRGVYLFYKISTKFLASSYLSVLVFAGEPAYLVCWFASSCEPRRSPETEGILCHQARGHVQGTCVCGSWLWDDHLCRFPASDKYSENINKGS